MNKSENPKIEIMKIEILIYDLLIDIYNKKTSVKLNKIFTI